VLAYTKKTADTDDDALYLAGLVQQNFADIAEFLVLLIIDIQSD
jgi:hypothetical protein